MSYRYDANNRLLTDTYVKGDYLYTDRYSYDTNGNLLSKGSSSEANNLLQNPGFESYTGTSGLADQWLLWSRNYLNMQSQVVQSPVYAGKQAQQVSGSNLPANDFVALHQVISVEPGKTFTLSGQFNVTSLINCKIWLYVNFFDASGQYLPSYVYEEPDPTSGRYVQIKGTGVVPDNAVTAKVQASLYAVADNGSGSFIVDSMDFHYGTDNLLHNPGFESYTSTTGLADEWSMRSSYVPDAKFDVVQSPVYEGKRAQQISGTILQTNGGVEVNQRITVEAGRPFTVSGQLNVNSLVNSKVQLYVDFYDSSNQFLPRFVVEYPTVTNGNFILLNGTGTIPANAVSAKIHVILRGTAANASGSLIVDAMDFHYGADNLLQNPSFESYTSASGLADQWSVWSNAGPIVKSDVVQSPVLEGKQAQQISASNLQTNDAVSLNQTIPVQAGKTFAVSGQFDVTGLYNCKVQMYVDFYDASNQFLPRFVLEYQKLTSGSFIMLKGGGTVPANAVSAKVHVIFRGTGANGIGSVAVDSMDFHYEN